MRRWRRPQESKPDDVGLAPNIGSDVPNKSRETADESVGTTRWATPGKRFVDTTRRVQHQWTDRSELAVSEPRLPQFND